MVVFDRVPSLAEAKQMLAKAGGMNPGPWVAHSIFTAQAAEIIAARHPALDPAKAYILGMLHDIGRREGVSDLRHTLDGYRYLFKMGYEDAAQVCLTHSFPTKSIRDGAGEWDCSPEELAFVEAYLSKVEYNEYDRLVKLCDALALPDGFCLIEKRLVDVALRHGVNDHTVEKWKAILAIQKEFEQAIGCSVYSLLPEVVENTFGFDLPAK